MSKNKKKATKSASIQQRHHYLNKIGVDSTGICVFNTANVITEKDRNKLYQEQRNKHGFDSRETWSMDYTLATWLYEHFKLYRKVAGKYVDLTFHKIKINVLKKDKKGEFKTKRKTVTQLEAIDLVCAYLEDYFKYLDGAKLKDENHAYQKLRGALHIVADIAPYMWW